MMNGLFVEREKYGETHVVSQNYCNIVMYDTDNGIAISCVAFSETAAIPIFEPLGGCNHTLYQQHTGVA